MTHVDIPFLRYLDEEGRPVATLPTWLDKAMLHTFYRNMVMVRSYDKKAIALQRTGKLGTFPSHLGAEAVGIGVGLAMQPEDVYVPYYRDMPTLYVRGVPMEQNLQYWGGDERGSVFYKADGELSEDLPICVPIATQITASLGLRGFMLNLSVESAAGFDDLLALLPKIQNAAGVKACRELERALKG